MRADSVVGLARAERHGGEALFLCGSFEGEAQMLPALGGTLRADPETGAAKAWAQDPILHDEGGLGPAAQASADGLGLLALSLDAVVMLDRDGYAVAANAPAGALPRAPAGGLPWPAGWGRPESNAAARTAFDSAVAGRAARFQAAFGVEEGATWWDVVVSPVEGRPGRVLAVARDMTEQKQGEARQAVLLQEMEHRLKNTLAIVQAIATQTLRNAPSLDAAGEALGARMQALAHAHDVLMQGAWASASLRGLVEGAARLHGDGTPERFRIAGPEVTVGPRPALTLALMLHELGTNAAKYGALSNPEGHVEIGWRIVGPAGQERLRFRWQECGGPPVVPPTRTGFGSRLIERSLVHSFGGSAHLSYPRGGVELTMEAPLAAVAADSA